jgi:hypothetical protein
LPTLTTEFSPAQSVNPKLSRNVLFFLRKMEVVQLQSTTAIFILPRAARHHGEEGQQGGQL